MTETTQDPAPETVITVTDMYSREYSYTGGSVDLEDGALLIASGGNGGHVAAYAPGFWLKVEDSRVSADDLVEALRSIAGWDKHDEDAAAGMREHARQALGRLAEAGR